MGPVIAVDPGREKCGVAVVDNNGVLWKKVIDTKDLAAAVAALTKQYQSEIVLIGNGTTGKQAKEAVEQILSGVSVKVLRVEEYRTTDLAKIRYWQENAPQGWRRLLPTSMQVPPVPVDDYVAVILAERYLTKQNCAQKGDSV